LRGGVAIYAAQANEQIDAEIGEKGRFRMKTSLEILKEKRMHILVCGGAGYIGSHMVKMLTESGHNVTIYDNLSTGYREAVKWGRLVVGDLLDEAVLRQLFVENSFDTVMHFSAKSLVGESVAAPAIRPFWLPMPPWQKKN